jgi:uncharacterized membrane protein
MTEGRVLNIPAEEIEQGKTMAIIAYIIFLVPLLVDEARKNRFAMYHTEQSIVLILISVACSVVATVTCGIGLVLFLPLLVLWVMGLVNAGQGQVKPVPLVGALGEKFGLVK